MEKGSYKKYLQSEAWRERANTRLKIDGNKCVMCGSTGTQNNPLNVHHLDYRSIGNENIDRDLVTLCKACHSSVHKMMNRITNRETGKHGWSDSIPISTVVISYDGSNNDVKAL